MAIFIDEGAYYASQPLPAGAVWHEWKVGSKGPHPHVLITRV